MLPPGKKNKKGNLFFQIDQSEKELLASSQSKRFWEPPLAPPPPLVPNNNLNPLSFWRRRCFWDTLRFGPQTLPLYDAKEDERERERERERASERDRQRRKESIRVESSREIYAHSCAQTLSLRCARKQGSAMVQNAMQEFMKASLSVGNQRGREQECLHKTVKRNEGREERRETDFLNLPL